MSGIPTISTTLADGSLVELVYNSEKHTTAFAVASPEGQVRVESSVTDGDKRLIPYAASNNLIVTGCVLLPSEVGDFGDKGELVDALCAFIHRYVDLSPEFEKIAAYYVLLTWVYDAYAELGYLRLRGDFGSGKSRGLITIGSLCYKPFFASGASTVSPLFHIMDAFRGTLVLDEADFRFSDATAELTKILNNGTVDGLPVLRTITNRHRELNPTAFRVFGPKLIAMRNSFSDQALESRFITEEMGQWPLRPGISIHLPATLRVEALVLRNRLLAWRFAARRHVGPDPARTIDGISPRLNQTALALLSLVDDPDTFRRLEGVLREQDRQHKDDRSRSLEALMVRAVISADAAGQSGLTPVSEVARCFNDLAANDLGHSVSNRWVGGFVRERLRLTTHKSNGVYVLTPSSRAQVRALAQRFGIKTP